MLPSDWNRYCIATLDLPFECHVEGRCWWFMIDNDTALEQLSFCFPTSSNPAVEVTWGQSPAVSSRVQEMPDTVIRCFVKKLVSYQPLTMNHSQWLSRNSSIHKLEVYGLVLGLPQYRINQIGDFFGVQPTLWNVDCEYTSILIGNQTGQSNPHVYCNDLQCMCGITDIHMSSIYVK